MKNLKGTTALTEETKWSKQYLDHVKECIKIEYENTDSTQKLKNKMFALSRKMEHYLRSEEDSSIQTIGYFLQEYISAFKKFRNITQKRLCEYWGILTSNLRKYITGERPLNAVLMCRIAKTFDSSPELWLGIQSKNELLKKILEMNKIPSKKNQYSFEEFIRT